MPLFPGESDIDTLHHILRALGNNLIDRQKKSFKKNPLFYGVKLPKASTFKPLEKLVPEMGVVEIDLLRKLLAFDPKDRNDVSPFLKHPYFESIKNSIENEIANLSELDKEEYDLFKKKKIHRNDEKQIIDRALDF